MLSLAQISAPLNLNKVTVRLLYFSSLLIEHTPSLSDLISEGNQEGSGPRAAAGGKQEVEEAVGGSAGLAEQQVHRQPL